MPDLSQFPLKKGVSLLNSGFTPLRTGWFCISYWFLLEEDVRISAVVL